MIVAPYVKSVSHVFAYIYTLDDDSECPIDYETSLLPNIFLGIELKEINIESTQ